jgi:phosphopantothenoylcysteine decarboxylase/phosphopantothenate--cysteine ligase
LKSKRYDVVIAVAAAADWTPEKQYSYKVSSHDLHSLELKLKPTAKIINSVKKVSPRTFLVAFRAEYKLPKKELIDSAYKRLLEAKADLIVVNDVGKKGVGFGTDTNEVFIIDKKKNIMHVQLAKKREVARKILDVIKDRIKPK